MRIDPGSHRAMIGATAVRRQPRAWLRVINAVLALAGEQAELIRHSERPWASVTFSGTRQSLQLLFAGTAGAEAAERFIEALPEHEFAIPGKLVADAVIVAVTQETLPEPQITLEAELLLLDDL